MGSFPPNLIHVNSLLTVFDCAPKTGCFFGLQSARRRPGLCDKHILISGDSLYNWGKITSALTTLTCLHAGGRTSQSSVNRTARHLRNKGFSRPRHLQEKECNHWLSPLTLCNEANFAPLQLVKYDDYGKMLNMKKIYGMSSLSLCKSLNDSRKLCI